MEHESTSPGEIARSTTPFNDSPGDFAEQADRLTMIMEAEAARNAIQGVTGEFAGEGSLDGFSYPLENIEDTLAMEDAQDSSDDPLHPGDELPAPWIPAEQAAIHVIGDIDMNNSTNTFNDPFSEESPITHVDYPLTPEDETLMGIAAKEERLP
jgi:hypothetical protein